jgi:pimeloyl-ACP methyl ester carboxylesterase
MKPFALFALSLALLAQQPGRGRGQAPVQLKPEDLARIKDRTEQIEAIVKQLRAMRADWADPARMDDVEVYAKAGRFLLEYPELINTQNALDHSTLVLDQGIERAKQLQKGTAPWTEGRSQIRAYRSELDGSVQPYHISLPAEYDPNKPTRLYVWLHGRQNNTTESEFIFSFMNTRPPGNAPVADQGQIQLDCFGRINGAGWHWGGESDVFEAIAAVKKRFKIDDRRIMLRGFSQGGEGGWHVALHHPDAFAAAEIGAGTWSRRAEQTTLKPWQRPPLEIWEDMEKYALNIFNLPLAAHDGDMDNQINAVNAPPGAPNPNSRGQLESSLHTRAQLEKEGFPCTGEPDNLHYEGAPGIFLISQKTGHGTSPLVRQRLDAFLKEWGDKGRTDPDRIRFVTYTTRYNKDYWVSLDGLDRHYTRADIDARRGDGGKQYEIATHNVSRLVLREAEHAQSIMIDGQSLRVKSSPELTLQKTGTAWKVDKNGLAPGLHKTHALQGPIDDAFLDPFLLVRPTGTPWNAAVNDQALRTLAHFDRMWGKYFRGHPFVKDDKDVTEADFGKYQIVLFGDPGSNKWIGKLNARLPVKWTRTQVTLAGKDYPAATNFPALIYPNPLHAGKYVVINTGLTISDPDYNGDYGMPQWGDYAIVQAKEGADVPELVTAGLFDENWRIQ